LPRHLPTAPADGRPGRLGRWFVTVAAITGALLLLAFAVGVAESHRAASKRTEVQAESLAILLSREAERLVHASNLMLEQMIALDRRTDWNSDKDRENATETLAYLKQLLPEVLNLVIVNEKGRARASTIAGPNFFTVDDRDYFRAHVEKDAGLFIGDPVIGRVFIRPIFTMSRRISDQHGNFAGIAFITFDPGVLGDFYERLSGLEETTFVWAKTNGQTLVRFPSLAPERLISARVSERFTSVVRANPAGGRHVYVSDFDGQERISFFRPVTLANLEPLYVGIGIPTDLATRHWLRDVWPHLLFALLAATGLCVLCAFAWRRVKVEDGFRLRLAQANRELEGRVAERTAELRDALGQAEGLVEQKELLLKEVNHRVKNSLQLVSSLLEIQGRSLRDGEAKRQLADAVARVTAVTQIHEQLNWTDDVRMVEVLAYLHKVCQELERSGPRGSWQVEVSGSPVMQPADRAMPLGLIVGELVTNAFKHGASRDGAGPENSRIEVRLDRLDGKLSLSVRDFGPGFAESGPPERPGSLGMRLIRSLAAQLDGSVSVESAEPGARFTILVPEA
jgi:two-component system, sensor histidine kinase PdtaS